MSWILPGVALVLIGCLAGCASSPAFPADSAGEPETASVDRSSPAATGELVRGARRIVFLGDSITYAGDYVGFFDAWLVTQGLESAPVVIDVGLPSETVSGLSEEGHAGGRFPRPHLAERLSRVLAITNPDVVLACYGINCGIYEPFDEERFHAYRRGIEELSRSVEAAGATLVLITPPTYDDQRTAKSFSYDAVLQRYSSWLVEQRSRSWLVIDLHAAMAAELTSRREVDPEFTFQPDGVHPNAEGHWFIAQQIILGLGDDEAGRWGSPEAMLTARNWPSEVLDVVGERLVVRRDAYLGAAAHRRPGLPGGQPVAVAEERAGRLSSKILELSGP